MAICSRRMRWDLRAYKGRVTQILRRETIFLTDGIVERHFSQP